MNQPLSVEEIFKSITKKFEEISQKVDTISKVIKDIGSNFTDSMGQVSGQIESLVNTLQAIIHVEDLMNLNKSIHELVGIFRKELDPVKMQKLILDLSQTVQKIKQKPKEHVGDQK